MQNLGNFNPKPVNFLYVFFLCCEFMITLCFIYYLKIIEIFFDMSIIHISMQYYTQVDREIEYIQLLL